MKKETFNLVIRLLIGVAASLVIVGAMGLITEAQGNKTFVEQASGLKGGEVVMTVNGEDVTVEEYLYMTAYAAQSLSYYGVTDLSMELGEGMTAADFVAEQAEGQLVASAALRAWAKEQGVTIQVVSPVVKPALAESSHCTGVRAESREERHSFLIRFSSGSLLRLWWYW